MKEVIFDAVLDSLKVFGIAFVIYFLFSFVHEKVEAGLASHKKISPIIGAGFGLIPECGISVVAADMYHQKHMSMGTILAIFFACSDEAFFLLCSDPKKIPYLIVLLCVKFIFGFSLGYIVDLCIRKKEAHQVSETLKLDCCVHPHEEEGKLHKHFLHPLFHCLKIFLYVCIVNLIFGGLVYFLGEERIISFLHQNSSLAPLFAGLVGLIPNCASSILLCELFLMDGISFGTIVTGLSVNAGVGILYLLKYKETRRSALAMTGILFLYSLGIGYIILCVMGCMN